MTVPIITLSDGVQIPQLGFGTFKIPQEDAERAVSEALRIGYRHIDTAAIYGNEVGVGAAIAASGLRRNEIFLTTKLWNDMHHYATARVAVETSLEKLGLDHIDLYLIHWPATLKYGDSYLEAWDALQEFKAEGLTRSIGVSNFNVAHLDAISGEIPSVNQVEIHPSLTQNELRAELANRSIVCEAWSPLGRGSDLSEPTIVRIAAELGRTPAQITIRWHLQLGNIVIPKSLTPARIAENLDVFNFELTTEQLDAITALDRDARTGSNPALADF
ncbi:MAG: aldo/keto reductase [Propionibacteriaceae bacterium]|jgi:2,5-diketo-D-gluconate reductase A|nr:aldo/keto reductase [Propionibacteriaceae bacterium]